MIRGSLGLGQESQRNQRIGGKQIECHRAVARVTEDAGKRRIGCDSQLTGKWFPGAD